KKAAKRAREKAVQAQIALKELTEQIARSTSPRIRTRSAAPALTGRKHAARPIGSVKPPGVSSHAQPVPSASGAKTMRRQAAARSAKTKLPAIEVSKPTGTESGSTQPGAPVESEELTRLGDFGEPGIRSGQPSRG